MRKPQRLRGGPVGQSGLNLQSRQGYSPPFAPKAWGYRAVVIRTYVQDDPANTRRKQQVTCDVILVSSNIPLYRVPVMQHGQYGVNNVHGLYVPRATSRSLTGEELNFRALSPQGSPTGRVTSLDDLDGDHVIVSFLESDPDMPIIVGSMTHEKTNRGVQTQVASPPVPGTPQKDDYYIHHYGAELRIGAEGDLVIDLSRVYGKTNADEGEEDQNEGRGSFIVRVKSSERMTVEVNGTPVLEVYRNGGEFRIDLGEAANERIILGDSWLSFFNNFITLFNSHVHPSGTGPTGAPTAAATSMTDALLSDISRTKKSS